MKCACCFTDNPADAQSCVACGQASWLDLPVVPVASEPAPLGDEQTPAASRKKGGR
jgi:hypothetical protein